MPFEITNININAATFFCVPNMRFSLLISCVLIIHAHACIVYTCIFMYGMNCEIDYELRHISFDSSILFIRSTRSHQRRAITDMFFLFAQIEFTYNMILVMFASAIMLMRKIFFHCLVSTAMLHVYVFCMIQL